MNIKNIFLNEEKKMKIKIQRNNSSSENPDVLVNQVKKKKKKKNTLNNTIKHRENIDSHIPSTNKYSTLTKCQNFNLTSTEVEKTG